MARVKSDKRKNFPINDWDEADDLVRRVGDLQLKINQAQHTAKDKIDEAKADLAEEIKKQQEYIKWYVESLEAFSAARQAELGKKRSRKLNFGILGWRKSTSIKTKKTTLERIKRVLSKAKAAACIRVKESVDKEALAKLTDKQLASVGARRDVKDVFFVEPDIPKAVDYCE